MDEIAETLDEALERRRRARRAALPEVTAEDLLAFARRKAAEPRGDRPGAFDYLDPARCALAQYWTEEHGTPRGDTMVAPLDKTIVKLPRTRAEYAEIGGLVPLARYSVPEQVLRGYDDELAARLYPDEKEELWRWSALAQRLEAYIEGAAEVRP